MLKIYCIIKKFIYTLKILHYLEVISKPNNVTIRVYIRFNKPIIFFFFGLQF